ncbi:GGDEF domain-containing protein [Motiliproteus sp. SC1-56]|uniref:GGDEF domain-containing protein n=1 Tax=Motiliproteus sp. SC1-56 TaxID=2799565 RepID=UPI001A8D7A68|nr:GGDEF domain-containing protein [Motiliproteus sp. SC1-56]
MSQIPDDADIGAWKRRCLELEQQLETGEADVETLGKTLQRLCAVAKGLDQELDSQVLPLQAALKQKPFDPRFRNQAGALERGILGYFQRREEGVNRSLEALRQQLTQLDELPLAEEGRSRLDELLQSLSERVENYYEYPRLLHEVALLQQQALRTVAATAPGSDAGEAAEAEEELQLVSLRIGGLLIELLEQLSVPVGLLPQARKLITRIESGFAWNELESLFSNALELALKSAVTGQEEFENYLAGLNAQLHDIQEFLGASRQHQTLVRNNANRLDTTLRRDFAQVEQSLDTAQTLDQLKRSVRQQLGDIVAAMDRYREDQAQREQETEARLAVMQKKLAGMEAEAKRVQHHLEEQRLRALSDPLTGLPNRAAYDERVKQEFARWARYAGELTLVACDLDRFKQINDTFGHLAGDKVLRLIGKLLPMGIRETDFVARYGGEEFVLLLPETSAEHSRAVMEKLRAKIAASPFNFKGEPVKITMSFGIAEFGPSETPAEVFHRADSALYEAKRKGRNCCVIAP